jgi:tetratricopeptide (TPR) repeat protein
MFNKLLFLCVFLFSLGASAQGGSELDRARDLIRAGDSAGALKLLAPREAEAAGDAEYDYLLGLAALETGDPSRATVALERALIVNPNHAGARLDLARAYFVLGDRERARSEFRISLAQNPPPAARTIIESYLARIDGMGGKGLRAQGYLEFGLGRDSNVNNATGANQIYVPVFGFSVQLSPTSQRTAASFAQFGAGGEVSYALTPTTSVFAGGDARLRFNRNADIYDFGQFDVRAGVQQGFGADRLLRASLTYQHYRLDQREYRVTPGLALEWRHALSSEWQYALFATGNRSRYQDPLQTANDTDIVIFGGGLTRTLDATRRAYVSASLYAGYERDTGERIDGDRKLYGLRLAGQTGVGGNIDIYAQIGYQPSRFGKRNVIFDAQREERLADAALGMIWRLDRDWLLQPRVTYTRNSANIDLNSYNRYEASIWLRREFK